MPLLAWNFKEVNMKDKIAQFIYGYLDWAYCDNCRYNFEDEDSDKCDCCYRKSIHWELSKKLQRS